MSKVTIIIPAYNAARYVSATVESVKNQRMEDWELILVNDGSTDGTGEIFDALALTDERIRVVHQENKGLSGARNQGVASLDKGDSAVLFLDADDLLQPHSLQVLLSALEAAPDAPAAHGAARFINSDGISYMEGRAEALSKRRFGVKNGALELWPLSEPTAFEILVYRNVIWTPGQVLLRRSALDATGEFNKAISPVADWDFWLRLTSRGPIVFLDEVVLDYRRHDSNMSSRSDIMRQVELIMRRQLAASSILSPEQHRIALRGYQLSEREAVRERFDSMRRSANHKRFDHAVKHVVHAGILYVRSHARRVW